MKPMNDVYHSVDSYLMDRYFYTHTLEDQKRLIDEGLKEYVLKKISELDLAKGIAFEKQKDEVSVEDLVGILGTMIPEKDHFDTLRHLTHYILNVAGGMQNFSITWWEEEDPSLIENPVIEFNAAGKWDSLKCHKKTSYVQAFCFAHQTFMGEFKEKGKENKSLILTPTTKALPEGDK